MTHLVDNLRFVWLGSLGLLSLQKVELSIRKVEMLSQVLLNWMTQEVSVLLYQFVKWLQCHKMSLSKQTDHILVPEWAWTVSHQSRNLWMFKSDLHHGDVHRSFYYMVPTDKAENIVGLITLYVYTMYHVPGKFGNGLVIWKFKVGQPLYAKACQLLWCGACIALVRYTCVYMWQSQLKWQCTRKEWLFSLSCPCGGFSGHILGITDL